MAHHNIPREAPLVTLNTDLYSFTVNVSAKKYVNGKVWSTYTHFDQKHILDDFLSSFQEFSDMLYVFEDTEAGYPHVHGMFRSDKEDAQLFQERVVKRFGMPKLAWEVCCKVDKIYDKAGWMRYMRKAQPQSPDLHIPNKSMFY